MATLYFTNNADAGDGSLRAVIAEALDGDTIAPDSTIADDLTTISLSSPISINKTLIFEGGTKRVRLDGQGLVRIVQVLDSDTVVKFNGYDFVNGFNDSTCGGICLFTSGASLYLNRCFLAGIKNASMGLGDIGTTSSSIKWKYVELNNCIFCGGSSQAFTPSRIDSLKVDCSSISGYVSNTVYDTIGATNSIITNSETSQTAGFIVAPSPSIASDNWNKDLWLDWDFRLSPNSPYLEGNTSENATDFLGRTRQSNGALGAIDGSYLIVNSDRTINEETTTDYLELNEGATLTFNVDEVALRIKREAKFLGGSFVGNSCFVVIPPETDTANVTADGVIFVRSGANVSDFTATGINKHTAQLSWRQSNNSIPVIVQELNGETWTIISSNAIEELTVTSSENTVIGNTYRIFDADKFIVATVDTIVYKYSVQYQVLSGTVGAIEKEQNWETVSQVIGVDDVNEIIKPGQAVTLLARIYDAFDNANALINTGTNIKAIRYTCERKTKGLYALEYTPVEGHENVEVSDTCILDELKTGDDAWNIDEVGYNFVLNPDVNTHTLFDDEGNYRFKVTVELMEGNPIVFYKDVNVQL